MTIYKFNQKEMGNTVQINKGQIIFVEWIAKSCEQIISLTSTVLWEVIGFSVRCLEQQDGPKSSVFILNKYLCGDIYRNIFGILNISLFMLTVKVE